MFSLRFPKEDVNYWASQYEGDFELEDKWIPTNITQPVQKRGYIVRDEFLRLAEWKSHRPRKHYQRNSDDYIEEATAVALSCRNEQLRVNVLMTLEGVSLPVASVLLHFTHRNPYPIIDLRAVWSLGKDEYRATFEFWWAYTQHCRQLANECQVTMRTLDRALWQYSKVNQSPS